MPFLDIYKAQVDLFDVMQLQDSGEIPDRVRQAGNPVWEYLPFDNLERWPSIQWKLRNIRLRMDPAKRTAAEARLREVLEL